MTFEDYQTKESVVVVYTGEGKGKTSASLGLLGRALGNRWHVAFIQFIKYWGVGCRDLLPEFPFVEQVRSPIFTSGRGRKRFEMFLEILAEKERPPPR